ncbi:MAG: hypothetical protein DSY46_05475 [Hydrogenimonas sp.]|nr:MAG: hypothetical protein DSY46_05475 [Hydrogenimonas sp.]
MRIFLVILLCLDVVFGYSYNDLLIDAQSRIYPKLIILQEGLTKQKEGDSITLGVVHMAEDEEIAHQIVQKIEHYHGHQIGVFHLDVQTIPFTALNPSMKIDALYLLKADAEHLKSAVAIGREKHIPIFVYDLNDLKYGALLALTIERSTVIYLNRSALSYSPRFNTVLYSIARFVNVGTD